MSDFLGDSATGAMYLEDGHLVMRRPRACFGCGQQFVAVRHGRRGRYTETCDDCRKPKRQQGQPCTTCLNCGNTNTYSGCGRRPRYCSNDCRNEAYRKTLQGRRPPRVPKPVRPVNVDAKCAHCGADFQDSLKRKGPRRLYCTNACCKAADNARRTGPASTRIRKPSPPIFKPCVICGAEIRARTGERYCGDECRAERDRRKNARRRAQTAANHDSCVVCGDAIRRGTKYCKAADCQRVKRRIKAQNYLAKPGVKERLAERARENRPPPKPRIPKPPPTPEELERRRQRSNERHKAWTEQHPERAKAAGARWRAANPEKVREMHQRARTKKIAENTRLINAAKGDHCTKCGKKKPLKFLHFHHVDPSTKYKNVSQMRAMSWARIEAEIAKCVVWCDVCHTAHHVDEDRRAKGQLQLVDAS